VVAFAAAVAASEPAQSEDWPQRPVRIIDPFAPGGSSDVTARIIAQRLASAFGQQVVVENHAGASGVMAAEMVARATPDGYTLFMATTGQISIMPVITRTAYDPIKDFAPISIVGTSPFVLVVHPGIPARTVAEFVDYVRARPNQLSYASSGIGSIGHLSMELFQKRAGLAMTPVMYKGGAAQLNDVIAGHVKITFFNLAAVTPFATSDALRLLAVTSGKRTPQIPDVPTLIESGYPSLKISALLGLMAPAGTPKDIVARIAGEVVRAAQDPQVAALLRSNGIEPVGSSPQDFAATIAADNAMWADAIKLGGPQDK
jgi:tripartite-type tricarboxylate transporter receptor subunit TctC